MSKWPNIRITDVDYDLYLAQKLIVFPSKDLTPFYTSIIIATPVRLSVRSMLPIFLKDESHRDFGFSGNMTQDNSNYGSKFEV